MGRSVGVFMDSAHGRSVPAGQMSSLALQGPGAIYSCFLLCAWFLINFLFPTMNLEKSVSYGNTTSLLATVDARQFIAGYIITHGPSYHHPVTSE